MTAILVVLTIVLFIVIDYLIHRKEGNAIIQAVNQVVNEPQHIKGNGSEIREKDIRLPTGVFLHPKHTWAHILQSGKVKVGIDDFIAKITGTIDRITLPAIGDVIKQGQTFFSINSGNKKLEFVAPVSGKIIQVNNDLLENPELLKEPYNFGWFAVIEPVNLSSNLMNLKIAEDAIDWLTSEFRHFREFLVTTANGQRFAVQTLPDGGLPAANILNQLSEEHWKRFQNEFLS